MSDVTNIGPGDEGVRVFTLYEPDDLDPSRHGDLKCAANATEMGDLEISLGLVVVGVDRDKGEPKATQAAVPALRAASIVSRLHRAVHSQSHLRLRPGISLVSSAS